MKLKHYSKENLLLYENGLYEDADPVTKSIPHQKSQQPQSSQGIHFLLAEIQHHLLMILSSLTTFYLISKIL